MADGSPRPPYQPGSPVGVRARTRFLLAVLLALGLAGLRAAVPVPAAVPDPPGPPRPKTPPRTDAHGDPLPPGARARLGTVRFRPGGAVAGVAFAPDGQTLATSDYSGAITLIETATGRELRRFGSD